MVGGDLHWAWKLYDFYGQIDKIYGVKAFEDGDGFANAAAILNLLENFAAITYLVLVYAIKSDIAPLFGYTGATVTLAKTILYLAQEYYCGWCAIGHNDFVDVLAYWVCPNVVWCTISSLTMYRLGNDIASSLRQRKTSIFVFKRRASCGSDPENLSFEPYPQRLACVVVQMFWRHGAGTELRRQEQFYARSMPANFWFVPQSKARFARGVDLGGD